MRTGRVLPLLAGLGLAWALGRAAGARRRIRWRPPAAASSHRILAARIVGEPTARPIVLLHGLAGSSSYWGVQFDRLADLGRLIVPDLLGFGASARPPSGYGPEDHASAILDLLAEIGAERPAAPALIVGHSLGGLIALALAAMRPASVSAVVAFTPPLYRGRRSARRRIAGSTSLGGLFALDTPIAEAVCRWHERHPRAAARLAPLLRPDLPAAIARDAVRHSWASYSETLDRVILAAAAPGRLDAIPGRVRLVAGAADPTLDLDWLQELTRRHPHVSLAVWPGAGHHLPLTHPEACLAEIEAAL